MASLLTNSRQEAVFWVTENRNEQPTDSPSEEVAGGAADTAQRGSARGSPSREMVLQVALDLVDENGLDALSMRRIGRVSSLSKPEGDRA